MNDFVDECRSEWKRLGVPDPVADEMAAELAADLEEAEAEGASAEDVLGSGAFDPRSFATAWAAERGVVQRPQASGREMPRRSRIAAAIGTFALIAITGAVLVILASPSAPRRLTISSPLRPPLSAVRVRPDGAAFSPDGRTVVVTAPLPAGGARIVAMDINDAGVNARAVGLVLLVVGLAGIVPLTMFWLWAWPERWSRRRARIDDRPSGPA